MTDMKLGPLALWCVQRCKDVKFHEWADVPDEEHAKAFVLKTCGIKSRHELDTDPAAAKRFDELVRRQFQAYVERGD